jgi:hypothetical protein
MRPLLDANTSDVSLAAAIVTFCRESISGHRVTPETFARDLGPARTFGFVHEVESLRAKGLIQGASLDNAIARHDRRDSSSNTLTSSTTRPVARSTHAPGLNAPVARVNAICDGQTIGLVARR